MIEVLTKFNNRIQTIEDGGGSQGSQGLQDETGSTGSQGADGTTGSTGSQGLFFFK